MFTFVYLRLLFTVLAFERYIRRRWADPLKSSVPTKRAAQPKAPKEDGTARQPTKKRTSASGARGTLQPPHDSADIPKVEETALTVLDRAVLLPRALIQRQVQTHHLKHMTCACACQYVHRPMQRRCAGARRRAYRGSDSASLIRVADRGRCSPITTN